MDGLTPSASVTKIGSVLVIFAIALLAVWAANNFPQIGKLVAPKPKAAA